MKRIFLFTLMLTFTVGSMAQLSKYARKYEQKIPKTTVDNPVMNPLQPANTTVNTKAVLEDQLGTTIYDLQTNGASQNRFYVYPDGTMAGTWTMGFLKTAYDDRGTGYNYFNGTSWGTAPTERIETQKTGWPSYCPWNGNGELVIAHPSTGLTLVMNTRTVKGIGNWTQTLAPVAPSGVSGGLAWQRTITSGLTHQNIHVICMTLPTSNGGTVYKGLDGALLYWRSTDAGATWDKIGIQLPGMDSTNYSAFGIDEYAWGTPHGDTIYFVAGGPYTDMFIMKSNDNGNNWTKIPILSNANKKIPVIPPYRAPWASSDGSVACEMGKNGVIHVCSGIGGGEIYDTTEYILINRNGLIYWNTTMPMLQDSLDLNVLDANGQLLGYYYDGPNPGDTLKVVQSYRVGLTSHPQISIDDAGNMIVIWDGITWQNPQNSTHSNYRHIWARGWTHANMQWAWPQLDLNSGIDYIYLEFVFPSMGKILLNYDECAHGIHGDYIYQTADTPGSAVITPTLPTQTCTIDHRQPCPPIGGVPTFKDSKKIFVGQNFPNPVNRTTTFNAYLDRTANVIVEVTDVTGETVMTIDNGFVTSGAHQFTIDASQLSTGLYFYTVKINGQSYTHKMIVE
jgi:hypothetical protein